MIFIPFAKLEYSFYSYYHIYSFFSYICFNETFHLYICWILKRKKNHGSRRINCWEKFDHGHNIRRFRIEKNMNQEVLSQSVHLSQSAVSKYEQMRVIDDEMLHRFSRALGVPFEYLKSLEKDAQTVVFENNTVNDSEQYTGGAKISLGTVKSYTEDSDNSTDNRVQLRILSKKSLNSTNVC